MNWSEIKAAVRRAAKGLFPIVLGAYAVCRYLTLTLDTPAPEIDRLANLLFGLGLLLLILSPQSPAQDRKGLTISPARSGVTVVLFTGLFAAIALTRGFEHWSDLIVPALVVPLTLVVAWFVYRFASVNAANIGEARFVTRRDGSTETPEPTR
ncbi:hypothetical protein G4G27_15050 [Sphingomonas sp. So64.6b]|uniref:hypothetical protein n=1 Tax=Sphingomonas sp. So64.6b TaxID=2997354 RepID=UPI0016047C28|nr:hypothetical protein [Sphingomonas sp. So64.6b]QNA85168.1 hypothetical protein G4G27_15050 [Sphingomonas sp. So64.6b]